MIKNKNSIWSDTEIPTYCIRIFGAVFLAFFASTLNWGFVSYLLTYGGIGYAIYLALKIYKEFKEFEAKNQPVEQHAPNYTAHGSARWATAEEFLNDGCNVDRSGAWIGRGVFRHKQSHFLTVAGSRQGKGTNVIIPNLLINPIGSYVVTDPKGENAFITANFQKKAGQKVYILDPWNEQGKYQAKHGIPASGFNPFDFIKENEDEIRDNCEMLAYYLVPDKPGAKDPYWDDRARSLIKTCLMHIVTAYEVDQQNFWTLYKMLRVSGEDLVKMLVEMKLNPSCDGIVSFGAEEFLGLDPNGQTLPSILSTAQRATTIFESPQLKRSLEKSDFNPHTLPNGNCTVYIVIPERYLESHSAWLRMVIGLCLKACNAKPNKPVYYFLDEFPVLGKMQEVIRAYAFGAGQNIRLWAFTQSLSHLKEIYGEDGLNALMSNVSVFQAFGINDPYTQTYISKVLGETTGVKYESSSGTSSSPGGGSTSSNTSSQTYARALMTPEEVGSCKQMIVITQNAKHLISKLAYYERIPVYGSPTVVGKKKFWQKEVPIEQPAPVFQWSEYFGARAQAPPRVVN